MMTRDSKGERLGGKEEDGDKGYSAVLIRPYHKRYVNTLFEAYRVPCREWVWGIVERVGRKSFLLLP